MKDLKEYSHDEFGQLQQELKTMSDERLKELLKTANEDHLEVKNIVTEMSAHSTGSEELEGKARLSSSLYGLTIKIKEQVNSNKTNKLYERSTAFKNDTDKASEHLSDVKDQFTKAVANGSDEDIRKLYEEVQSAEYELQYRIAKNNAFQRFADDERKQLIY